MMLDPLDEDLREIHWHLNNGYMRGTINKKRIYAHRVIADRMGIFGLIDHVNGNRLDNRRENLREATAAQNNRNQRGHRDRLYSKFKGVTRGRRNGWAAQITNNSRVIGLGTYSTEEEAARAYDMAARFLFGEFARCNFEGEEAKSPAAILDSLIKKRTKYGVQGVSFIKSTGRYRVYKTGTGTSFTHVGTFGTVEEAVSAAKAQRL